MKKVVIIGSGPTGLITGLSLSEKEANFDINIFDASEYIGGLTGSEEIDGMPFDYGPHIFHSNDEEITKFIKKHCSDLLVEKEFLYSFSVFLASIKALRRSSLRPSSALISSD